MNAEPGTLGPGCHRARSNGRIERVDRAPDAVAHALEAPTEPEALAALAVTRHSSIDEVDDRGGDGVGMRVGAEVAGAGTTTVSTSANIAASSCAAR